MSYLLHVTLTQGHRHETVKAGELIAHAQGKACIGDSGYSSQAIIDAIRARGMKPVIAVHPTHTNIKLRLDRKLYALRYRVECGFHSLKRFRAVAASLASW